MELSLQSVSEFVHEHLEGVKESKNGEHFLARCPICGDSKRSKSKKRFNLEYNNGKVIWHCFNCGESGNFYTLYKSITGEDYFVKKKRFDKSSLVKQLNGNKKQEEMEESHNILFNIMDDCISIHDIVDSHQKNEYKKHLQDFIEKRKVSPDSVFIAYRGRFQGRIIIPIFDSCKNVIYFQGRAIDNNIQPKYLNPIAEKHNIILNKHLFDRSKYIIVVEGLLDAMSIGDQGTTVLGKELLDSFLKELYTYTDKGVIVSLDNDVEGQNSLKKILKKSIYRKKLGYFLFPGDYNSCKDINELLTKYSLIDVYNFIVDNSLNYTKAYTEVCLKRRKLEVQGVENHKNRFGLYHN